MLNNGSLTGGADFSLSGLHKILKKKSMLSSFWQDNIMKKMGTVDWTSTTGYGNPVKCDCQSHDGSGEEVKRIS